MEEGSDNNSQNTSPPKVIASAEAVITTCSSPTSVETSDVSRVSESSDSKSLTENDESPDSKSQSSDDRTSSRIASRITDDSHHTIMSACSTVGEHIRRNITDTLKSRSATEDVTSRLQAAMIEKLEKFESTVMEKLTDVSPKTSDVVSQVEEDDKSSILPSESCDTEQETTVQNASVELSAKTEEEQSSENNSLCIGRPQSESICNLLEDHFNKTVTKTMSSELCQSIVNILKSRVPALETTSPGDLSTSLESVVGELLENLKTGLIEKVSEGLPCPLDGEETSSLSGEAETAEKECADDIASETTLDLQNDDTLDTKDSTISHNTLLNESKTFKKPQRSGAHKKKGEKTIGFFTSQILKSLSSYSTDDEKLNVLCRKHAETLDKLKTTEIYQKQNERQVIQLSREKEQLQAEHNRNILAKSRLESLCRELQRQNRAVKEESLIRIREEEEKRKEVASKFQMTLNEISNLMQENSKKNLQLKEENAELAQKLKTLVEHYEMWEKHMEKVVQQKDLEAQLAKAKQAKINLQLKQETETFLQEKRTLLENMSELQKKCTQLASNELVLRAELSDYTSKYEEFQSVLNKSNQIFASFKTDMDTTSKRIKKLEKETNVWKQKWETSNNALLNMIVEKQTRDEELQNAKQRILTLEKLCRALQAERNDLQSKVNEKLTEENCNIPSEVLGETQAC